MWQKMRRTVFNYFHGGRIDLANQIQSFFFKQPNSINHHNNMKTFAEAMMKYK